MKPLACISAILCAMACAAAEAGATAIEFHGAVHFTDAQLRAAIADQAAELDQQGATPALADDAAFFLSLFYRKQGYAFVQVASSVPGPRAVALDISEGPLTLLTRLDLHGVLGLSSTGVSNTILAATRGRFPKQKGLLPFVQADIDAGISETRGLYASQGFLNAVVDPAMVTYSAGNTRAAVSITIHEGTQYHFGKITFTGDLVFYPNTELLKQLEPFTSKPYTPGQVTNIQRAVVYFYKTNGYYDPKVDVQSDPKSAGPDGKVPVMFNIESGAVYRFGGVSQEGLQRLHPRFLPSRFAALRGQFYNPEKLDEKFREMMQTGLFRELRIEPRPLPDHTVELHMNVDEEKSKELGASLGYGTQEGPIIGAVAGDRDLFGSGRSLTANVELSSNFIRDEVLYSDPWLLDSPYALRVRLYGQSQQWYRYNVLETGFRPEISRKLTKQLQASLFFLAKEAKDTDQGIDTKYFGRSNYFLSSAGTTLTYDSRTPDKINPRGGIIGTAAGEVASSFLGSTVEFARVTASITDYLPLTSRTLLALGARGGWLKPFSGNDSEIPINERFFNGGSRSVRSFLERRLGPTDWHGYTIGGDTFTTFNAEYQFPLYYQVMGAVFADAGSVGATSGSLGRMRYGVGPGLRYASPVGPIRIDAGFNPDRRTGERRLVIQVSFGMAF